MLIAKLLMQIPEWVVLCAPFFVCTGVCGGILYRRDGRLARAAVVDLVLSLGGILVIGLDKHVIPLFAQNVFVDHIDDFFVGPVSIGTLNLLLVVLRRAPWRSFARCFLFSLGFGLALELVYPLCSAHVGADWFDLSVYVAGGLATALVYWIVLRDKA